MAVRPDDAPGGVTIATAAKENDAVFAANRAVGHVSFAVGARQGGRVDWAPTRRDEADDPESQGQGSEPPAQHAPSISVSAATARRSTEQAPAR